jgi:hypothetical protein
MTVTEFSYFRNIHVRVLSYCFVPKIFDVNIVAPVFCVLHAALMTLEYSSVFEGVLI